MIKVITFLGKYPKPTQYEFQGKVYTGGVFAEALCQFLSFDEMLVLVTREANQKSWPVLEKLGDSRLKKIDIPLGESTEQMWEMFDILTSLVQSGEEVIFDITHGLRSLPFLVFLFAAYLKSAKRVHIRAIYYGAFELGNAENNKPAPVIDLSGFVGMIDWLTASDRFIRFGDSQDLASLLRKTGRFHPDNPVNQAIETLESLSQSLRLIRPVESMEISAILPNALEAARSITTEIPSAHPYTLLVEDLKSAYEPFAQLEPMAANNIQIGLDKQRDLINWYVEHQQWVQAVSLAREWLITWVMFQVGETDFFDLRQREAVADLMSKEAQRLKEAKKSKVNFQPIFLKGIPEITTVLGDWLSLTGVRNDIDHAGMRENAQPAASLIKSIRKLCSKLSRLSVGR